MARAHIVLTIYVLSTHFHAHGDKFPRAQHPLSTRSATHFSRAQRPLPTRMEPPRLRWKAKSLDFRFPYTPKSQEDKAILKGWWTAFKIDSHPRHAIGESITLDNDDVLQKSSAWQIFHDKQNARNIIYDMDPLQIIAGGTGRAMVHIIMNNPSDTISFTRLEDQSVYNVKLYPTEPFVYVFYASLLSPGTYTVPGLDSIFTVLPSEELLSDTQWENYFDILFLQPISKERLRRSWSLGAQVLARRGKRAATTREIQHFVAGYNSEELHVCIDSVISTEKRMCWFSNKFKNNFGTTPWLQAEHDQYENITLSILERTQPRSLVRILNLNGELNVFHIHVTYAPMNAEHCLLMATLTPHTPELGYELLLAYCQRELN